MLKVNNKDTGRRRSSGFIVNFVYISQLFLVFPLLILRKYILAGSFLLVCYDGENIRTNEIALFGEYYFCNIYLLQIYLDFLLALSCILQILLDRVAKFFFYSL